MRSGGDEARIALGRLAGLRGVARSYEDQGGRRRRTSTSSLLAVLGALGEPLASVRDAPDALLQRREMLTAQVLPPVLVAWDGRLPHLDAVAGPGRLDLEGGGSISLPARRPVRGATGGTSRAHAAEAVPLGVHELVLGGAAEGGRSWVISTPSVLPGARGRTFGLFAPTYALLDERGRDLGDLSALRRLGEIVAGVGGGVVATLPLLADFAHLDGPPGGSSPYSPVSRMWWNEAYLDLARLPEVVSRPRRRLPRRDGLSDPADVAGRIRPALDGALDRLEAAGGARLSAFRAFCAERPDLGAYARFRAAVEVAGCDRARWPARWRRGVIRPSDVPAGIVRRHLYAQWASDAEIGEDAASLAAAGCRLLLDLPVGCRRDGFDPFAHPGSFALGASIGAPPDGFSPMGQDWDLPPLDPEGDRQAGYPVLRGVLAHGMRHAGVLRIDHAMGLERLWWIPAGSPASEGAYVSYRSDELFALVCLEASRRRAVIVAEDLGTVRRSFRRRLARHGIGQMRVAVFDLEADPGSPMRPPAGSLALLDTHDTATFAGFVSGHDVAERCGLGLLRPDEAADAADRRADVVRRLTRRLVAAGRLVASDAHDPLELLAALAEELGESAAEFVILAAEDLFGELEPQNIPGSGARRANFARRMRWPIEEIAERPAAKSALGRLAAARARPAPVPR